MGTTVTRQRKKAMNIFVLKLLHARHLLNALYGISHLPFIILGTWHY